MLKTLPTSRLLTTFRLSSCCLIALCVGLPSIQADEEQPIKPAEVKLGRPVDFAKDIAPIFQANCVACHNKGKSEGSLNLENTATIMKGSSSGQTVVPGKPDESYLYQVAARNEESFMPPYPNEVQAKKLTPEQVGLLRQWILEGAKAGSEASAANMQWQAINNELTAIYAVDADPYGRFVAAGRAGTATVYDLLIPENVASLRDPALAEKKSPSQTAHLDYVHSMAFHPQGQMLATSGYQVVKLWQRDTSNAIAPLALPSTTTKMVTSSDGLTAAVQQADGIIRVLDLTSGAVVHELPGHDAEAVTLLGIHGPERQWISISTAEGIVKLMKTTDNSVAATSESLGGKLTDAAWITAASKLIVLQEDGSLRPLTLDAAAQTLAAADAIKSDKGAIQEITVAEPQLLCRIEGNIVELRKTDSLQPSATIQSATPNASAAISTDAAKVVTVSPDGIVELWNAADGKLVATLNTDLLAARQLAEKVKAKAVRDARVTVVKGQVTEDEKRVTEQQESLKKAEEELKKATEAVAEPKKKLEEAVAKTAEATKASTDKPDDAALKKALEAAQKAETAAKDALTAAENSVKSAEKGKTLSEQAIVRAQEKVAQRKTELAAVEADAAKAAEAHTAADAEAKKTIVAQHAAFVGTGLVATIDNTGTTRLWKAADGAAVDLFPGTLAEAAAPVTVAGSAQSVLVQQADGQLARIHAFPEWKLVRSLGPQGEGKPSVFVDRVLSLAFSPSGDLLAAGGGEASRSGELTLWNVTDGSLVRVFEDAHSDTVYGLDFSADGSLLASAAADKFVKVFDVTSGEHVRSFEGHTHHVMDVSWKGDRTTLASAGADNAIKVWNAETGEQSRTITTYQKQVTSLSFIGMEDEFISCSGDKRVFRHRAANGGTVREFKGSPDYVYCSATTGDGSLVVAGGEDGVLRVWNGADAKEVATFAPASASP